MILTAYFTQPHRGYFSLCVLDESDALWFRKFSREFAVYLAKMLVGLVGTWLKNEGLSS